MRRGLVVVLVRCCWYKTYNKPGSPWTEANRTSTPIVSSVFIKLCRKRPRSHHAEMFCWKNPLRLARLSQTGSGVSLDWIKVFLFYTRLIKSWIHRLQVCFWKDSSFKKSLNHSLRAHMKYLICREHETKPKPQIAGYLIPQRRGMKNSARF